MEVAVVDFTAPFAPHEFTRSLRETGFAVVTNHPVSQALVEEVYGEWLTFFESDAKYAYRYEDGDQDGYFAPDVSETAKGNNIKDIKEFFHVYPWGKYPTEVSDAALRLHHEDKIGLATLLRPLTIAPATLLGLAAGRLAVGAPADLTVFDPTAAWVVDRDQLHSRSKNSPFDETTLHGRVLSTMVGGNMVYQYA